MNFASHIFRHSKQLRNAPQQDHVVLVPWFSHSARCVTSKGDDISKLSLINNVHGVNICGCKSCTGSVSSTPMFIRSYRALNFTKVHNGLAARAEGSSVSGMMFSRGISCSDVQLRRSFSSNSGFPPHQELGMPSLSPTMTEGNIARWLKKEGNQVTTGEDKTIVEMKCMEEGYLAKIIHGDGAKEIKVGEVIAITVEDKDDIEKFKDYKPQSSDVAAPPAPLTSTPAKEDVVEKPVSLPEPKTVKPSAPPETDRVLIECIIAELEESNKNLASLKVDADAVKGGIFAVLLENKLVANDRAR